jgi:hypothetical protein
MLQVHSINDGKLLARAHVERERTTLRLAESSTPQQLIVWRDGVPDAERHCIRAFQAEAVGKFPGGSSVTLSQTWSVVEKRGLCQEPIAVTSDKLMYLTQDGVLCVFNRKTGVLISETPLNTKPCTSGGISLAGDQLLVTHGQYAISFHLATIET